MKNKFKLIKIFDQIKISIDKMIEIEDDILKISKLLKNTLRKNKIIFCGNGGSAADSSHVVAELIGRYLKKKRRSLNAISLNENISTITALSNDFNYKYIFSRQLEGVGKRGDVLFAISTSGKSKNILEAIKISKKLGIKTIMLTGLNKFNKSKVDHCIKVPAKRVDRIQELHIIVLHIISEYLDESFN